MKDTWEQHLHKPKTPQKLKFVCVCVYIYIYIYREREREREKYIIRNLTGGIIFQKSNSKMNNVFC